MGDRTYKWEDCPKCKGKKTVQVYDAPSSLTYSAECSKCGWKSDLNYYEVDTNEILLTTLKEYKKIIKNKKQLWK